MPTTRDPASGQRVDDGAAWAFLATLLSGERVPASAVYSWLAANPEWELTTYNPRAASTGTSKGAAGSVGNAEVCVYAGPCVLGAIVTENDTAAGDILIRDAAATGTSAVAQALTATLNTVSTFQLGRKMANGLCICGSATGVSLNVLWKRTQ